MKVKALKKVNKKGTKEKYTKGDEFTLPKERAEAAIKRGLVQEIETEKKEGKPETEKKETE